MGHHAHDKKSKKKSTDVDSFRKKLDPKSRKAYDLMFSKHYVLTGIVFGYIVANIIVLAGGGYLIDRLFGTHPFFFITGFLLSFASTQYCIYKRFRKHL